VGGEVSDERLMKCPCCEGQVSVYFDPEAKVHVEHVGGPCDGWYYAARSLPWFPKTPEGFFGRPIGELLKALTQPPKKS
jgi:hypothetical protein